VTVLVNHDFPHTGDLRVVDKFGEPLSGVEIRIFKLEKFLAGDTLTWEASTVTDTNGEWVDTISLADGQSWAVHFQKLSVGGPTHREIIT
jgi:hypothetical protein